MRKKKKKKKGKMGKEGEHKKLIETKVKTQLKKRVQLQT